ncbi:MAG: hypothetical protein WCQ77_02220 [Planctomycetota bacterium]
MRGLHQFSTNCGRKRLAAVAAGLLLAAHSPQLMIAVAVAAPAAVQSLAQIDDAWAAEVAGLLWRAEAGGYGELVKAIRGWQLPDLGERQFVLAIPSEPQTTPPNWADTPGAQTIWEDFLAARQARAAGTFTVAVAASQSHDGQTGEAIRLLYRVLRDDPDHKRARTAGGWVKRQGSWVWPETARHLDQGEEYSAAFGWLPKGRQQRYQAGERYENGRWRKAVADANEPTESLRRVTGKQPRDLEQRGWKFASDHWQITAASASSGVASLAAQLEDTRTVWLQVFGAFQYEPAEWEQRLEGRGQRKPLDPFAATLAVDRQAYIAALEAVEPMIGRTLGIYWTPTHTAWFFEGEGQQATTVHHEATHQLFAEVRKTSPLAGERCGFWAIEAAACYMESLEKTDFGWTVGGRDRGRAPMARERLLEDGFYMTLEELTSLGRRDFQADERLPQIYSEISGLADFFMNGQRGRYREAFVEYLVRIHTGTVEADTLSRLCKKSYAELDNEYRHHMAR